MIRVGSLCTGYGGIEMGLRLAGLDPIVSWVAETAPELAPLYGPTPNLGDIARVDWSAVEPIDVLAAGFPCQPVSAAGRQRGDADARWLWPAVWSAVAELQPTRVFIENVRNLIAWEGGRLWAGILDDLATLGYGVRWLTLGACHVGAAHHRHRVFALATMGAAGVERLPMSFCGAKGGTVLPTPAAVSYGSNQGGAAGRVGPVRHSLDALARLELLPTPTARDGDGRGTGDAGYWDRRTRTGRTNGFPLDATVALLPTPTRQNSYGNGVNNRGEPLLPGAVQPEHWGRFAVAVDAHAARYGLPPAPTEPNRNGAPRLAPAFAEWLMCLPAGHVTAKLDRVPALRAIGNGVCPPQAAAAWGLLS